MLLLHRVRLLFAVPMLWAQSWDPLAHFISLPSLSKKELKPPFFKELPTIRHRDLGEALEQVHFLWFHLEEMPCSHSHLDF
jgi:hypothetical protein